MTTATLPATTLILFDAPSAGASKGLSLPKSMPLGITLGRAARSSPGSPAGSAMVPNRRAADVLRIFRSLGMPVLHVVPDTQDMASSDHPEDEPIVARNGDNAFQGTELEARLRDIGTERVVICGTAAHTGMAATSRTAADLGFDTWLVQDGHLLARSGRPTSAHIAAQSIHVADLGAALGFDGHEGG